jgi:hypothetical protein
MRKSSIKNSIWSAESLLLPAVFLYFLLLTFFLKTIFIVNYLDFPDVERVWFNYPLKLL